VTNYNQVGQEYVSHFAAFSEVAYGTLQLQGSGLLDHLRKVTVGRGDAPLPTDLLKLLTRLETVFYYSSRIAIYVGEIAKLPSSAKKLLTPEAASDFSPPLQLTRNHKELGMEFESLILHSVAALDTLANVCAAHCKDCKSFNGKGNEIQIYFSNLKSALQNSLAVDARASHLIQLIDECEPALENIVLSIGRKTLRNQIAHEAPIQDLTNSNFVIYWLDDGRVLRFDHDVYEMPLVASSRNLAWTMAYLVVKATTIFLSLSEKGHVDKALEDAMAVGRSIFEPSWPNPFIHWRQFLSNNSADPEFTVTRTNADGVTITNVRLKPTVLEHAVPL
jgi:hypothetical protein